MQNGSARYPSDNAPGANWNIHGQSTFIEQAYPSFRSPYEGPKSLPVVFNTGGAIVELEERYKVFNQPGKSRLGAFANVGRTGNCDEALAVAA
jgi:hypothetical protein